MSSTGISRRAIPSYLVYPRMLGYAIGLVMHILNVFSMLNTFKGDLLQDPAVKRFHDDQFKFLTIWNVHTQMLYLALGLSCDVLSLTNEGKDSSLVKTLKRIRDPMFSSLVFPLSLTVATVFWACSSYERSLILPPSVDQALGWTSNHVIHTAIVPVVLWEVVFRPRRAPETHVPNLVLMNGYVGVYLAVIITSYLNLGIWVYPILNLLDGTIYLYLFFCIGVVLGQAFYRLQWFLTTLVWGSREDMKKIMSSSIYFRLLGQAVTLALHTSNSMTMFFSMHDEELLKDIAVLKMTSMQSRYLTVWNIAFQMLYFSLAFACDFLTVIGRDNLIPKSIRRFRKTFFSSVIFTMGVLIFAIFWPIFIYDRELLFPSFIDKIFSFKSNLVMHFCILPSAVWELAFLPRPVQMSHWLNVAILAVLYVLYTSLILHTYNQEGVFPYPILVKTYGTIYFPMFLFAVLILGLAIYFSQSKVYSLIWGEEKTRGASKIKSS